MVAYTRKKKRGRRRKFSRKQRGGGNGAKDRNIAFYSCFFGDSASVANQVPPLPSEKYDCYFFTNNKDTSNKAKSAGWIPVLNNAIQNGSDRENALNSKKVKACPHLFNELKGYKYTCYFDSKLRVYENDIENFLNEFKEGVVMLLNKHSFIKGSVNDEFEEAMKQPRYAVDREKYKGFIDSNLKAGLKDTVDVHYETGLIIRLSGDKVNSIGEKWYEYIKETGPECQISFFFTQQEFKETIRPLSKHYGY